MEPGARTQLCSGAVGGFGCEASTGVAPSMAVAPSMRWSNFHQRLRALPQNPGTTQVNRMGLSPYLTSVRSLLLVGALPKQWVTQ